MPPYIAMLRGINVGGHKTIRMEHLRALCSDIGFQKVETYVQSENIIFQSPMESPAAVSQSIGEAILHSFGAKAPVIVRTSKQMRSLVANNPFLKVEDLDTSKLHVTFLSEIAQKGSLQRLRELATSPDRFHATQDEIYLYCPNGYFRTKLSNNAIEKALSVTATTRNWKTTNVLFQIVSKLGP